MRLLLLLPLMIATGAQDAAVPDAAGGEDGVVAIQTVATRMTVPVSVAGAAPRPFVVDTGAERSVVSRQLAAQLGLAPGPQIRVTTMTGESRVPTVRVPTLAVGPVRETRAFDAPALEAVHLGAEGLLGIAQLRDHMVAIDFDAGEMAVRPSRADRAAPPPPRDPDEVVIVARSRMGQLIVTDAVLEGHRVTVVLDTGSQVSIGNLALQRRLRRIPLKGPIELTGVTGQTLSVNYHLAQEVRIGGVAMRGLPVAFADVPPFARFGLGQRPALLLGMDALRAFRRVEIDFPARRVRFVMRDKFAMRDRGARGPTG